MKDGLPGALRKREVQLRRGRVWNVEKVRDHLEVHGLSSRSSSKAHPRIQDWKKSRNNTWIICWIFRNVIRLSSEVVKFHKSSLITKKEINSSWKKVNLKLTKWFVTWEIFETKNWSNLLLQWHDLCKNRSEVW